MSTRLGNPYARQKQGLGHGFSRTCDIPVIALSANAMPQGIEHAEAAGAVDYLTKPLGLVALVSKVSQVLRFNS
jgi:CheY-like chemotaxis protein